MSENETDGVWPNGRATVFGAVKCRFESYHSREYRERMLANRVTKRKSGYKTKKGWIELPYTSKKRERLREKRRKEGYIRGWAREKKNRKVYLRYTEEGVGSRTERKRRRKPSRSRSVDKGQRWGRSEDTGMYRIQTKKGRRTSVEARKRKQGGRAYRWVI